MNIKVNFPKDKSHTYNLAFIKALLIKATIDNLKIDIEEKEEIRSNILEHLENNELHI